MIAIYLLSSLFLMWPFFGVGPAKVPRLFLHIGGSMKVTQGVKPLVFEEDGDELRITYSNRGEPFREGVEFQFNNLDEQRTQVSRVMLDSREILQLRNKLNEFLGTTERTD
jgi:hypothetical protein